MQGAEVYKKSMRNNLQTPRRAVITELRASLHSCQKVNI